eukprot:CAMPEP_0198511036 /NCGR_PEP_ID=MMETSP1462-20131121/14556_1 /TAXON_ID=1333877 /ORGANISM="Brandtodinium nutriculum, Strain RCC3387" /LENGTH=41 /DNA_ID= /DNA_START= /DNA_END= /DNA_ORIENTATION=
MPEKPPDKSATIKDKMNPRDLTMWQNLSPSTTSRTMLVMAA